MRCSCFAICLLLIISIKRNDGSWLSQFTGSNAFAPHIREAPSLEELERTDPDLYQQVVAARPELLYLRKQLGPHSKIDDLRIVDPIVYQLVIAEHPRLAEPGSPPHRRWKFLERGNPKLIQQHPDIEKPRVARDLHPGLTVLKKVDPELYHQLVTQRPDLTESPPRPSPTLNDLRRIDPDMYQRVMEELQTQKTDYEDSFLDNQDVERGNLTELRLRDNATRYSLRSRRDNGAARWNYRWAMLDYYLGMWPHYVGRRVQSCYDCGYAEGIPRSPLCHDAFESPDWRARTTARYFRSKCYRNNYNDMDSYSRKKPLYEDEKVFYNNSGHKNRVYGKKVGGCYKRFLDVGKVYTQRGCRRWPPGPWHSNRQSTYNFATHRYRKLEYLLGREKRDRCLFSPHASLTPFHRGISLFARYHVCVCYTDYCNAAPAHTPETHAALAVFAINFVLIIKR